MYKSFDLKFTPLGTFEKFSHLFTIMNVQKNNYSNNNQN